MIQVYKSPKAPKSLETGRQYNKPDVRKQLFKDQHSKCYICERRLVTDDHIDHLFSQAQHPDKRTDWGNLLLACSYCNQKKSNAYDQIINPLRYPIETLIKQEVDYQENKAIFENSKDQDLAHINKTIELLRCVFNGKYPAREDREERFYRDFLSRINLFQKACTQFLKDSTEDNKLIVCEYLQEDQEFLGFKYWIIQSNQTLQKTFLPACQWNREKETCNQ